MTCEHNKISNHRSGGGDRAGINVCDDCGAMVNMQDIYNKEYQKAYDLGVKDGIRNGLVRVGTLMGYNDEIGKCLQHCDCHYQVLEIYEEAIKQPKD